MRTEDFSYSLPQESIAQAPAARRDASQLVVVQRTPQRAVEFTHFHRILNYLRPGDLLIANNSKVIPARLRGRKVDGGGQIEVLLLSQATEGGWWVMLRPGKRVRPETRIAFADSDATRHAVVREKADDGRCRLEFDPGVDVLAFADRHGEIPLPPYISRPTPVSDDRERYQTVYSSNPGSVAAPTAGLHFTPENLDRLQAGGIEFRTLTLHVGLGTFAPVKADDLKDHVMHTESYRVPPETADAIRQARNQKRRIIAVGTTSLRVLEGVAASHRGDVVAGEGQTGIFIYPPAKFQVADGLLTNFHLPRSTLLMLVSAFASPGAIDGREFILGIYQEAISRGLRFFSYGDAMLIV
ncbi:MAG: tRNA preQ1(34) S-adenosylmethionine ribosyltransferase-isomerase QueA [Verrucomicrobiales bacterium]|nr:tRNA preQ1(34) S-adenosylmethionine ribosyltransferase-isomerase QueA [Verrucomicrobiales bacterium]